MKLLQHYKILLLLAAVLIDGCTVGYNTTLFTTRSNIGINVDTKPPVAEIAISRQEGVISPGFEGGQTPPVIASFQTHANAFSRFFFGVKSTFAGGDAAVGLAKGPSGDLVGNESGVCLSEKPEPKKFSVFGWEFLDASVPEAGQIKPFFMTTDTNLGLKLAWSGMTGPFPDTIRLGFHRNELAMAPVYGTDRTQNCKIPGTNIDGQYVVWMPSFLAVLDNDVQTGSPQQTGLTWRQYFATGKSATALANNQVVRAVMQDDVYPETTTGIYDDNDPNVACVDKWLNTDSRHSDILQNWWIANGNDGIAVLLIKDQAHKQQRADFIRSQKDIKCN